MLRAVPRLGWKQPPWRLVERNILAYRRIWYIFLSGFFEPLFFLLSIGIGVGSLVGDLTVGDTVVDYRTFVAPALLATAAMNGSLLDTTFNFFFKYKYAHTYDGVVSTPVEAGDIAIGEQIWALLRGAIYSGVFLITMLFFGVIESWWAVLALPVAVLIGFAFAGAGLACTTWLRSWPDFEFVNMAMIPMFLFSATFFPVSEYSPLIEAVVKITPLYQGVVLERGLCVGEVHWSMLLNAAYLLVMGVAGVRVASRRITRLLKP